MRRRQIPESAIYHVVGDADEILERADGRTEDTGTWEGRTIFVVLEGDEEADGPTVVTVIEQETRKQQRR